LLLNIDLHERQADSTLKLALRMQSAGAGATLNVRDYDLGVFFNFATYDPPFGIASALLSSGQTSVLRNSSLRAALGRWPAAIADGVEDQLMLHEISTARIQPLLENSVENMQPVHASYTEETVHIDYSRAILNTKSDIIVSQELWNVLFHHYARNLVTLSDLELTGIQLTELIDLVAQELGD